VAHTYNPRYSGSRDQANSLKDTISKKTHHKNRAGGVAQGEGLEFKPQYCKKFFKKFLKQTQTLRNDCEKK
jgi:hypothetical protein